MRFELMGCENTILREIAMPEMKRRDIAQIYALTMRSGEAVDWGKINAAIISRWSKSGLVWIKEQAHSGKCFKERPQ
jgi:hypothetical protein